MSDQDSPEIEMPQKDTSRKDQRAARFVGTTTGSPAVTPFADPASVVTMDTVTDAAKAATEASLAPATAARTARRPIAAAADVAAAESDAENAAPLTRAPEPAAVLSVPVAADSPAPSSIDPTLALPEQMNSMERVMTTAEEMMSFQQGNFEALVKSGQIWAAGLQDLGRQWAATAQAQFDETVGTVKAMTSVKSLREAVELHSTLARTSIEKAVAEGGKLTDASLKLTEQTMAPITARLSAAAERFGRTA